MWLITPDYALQSEHIIGIATGGAGDFHRLHLNDFQDFPQGKHFFVSAMLVNGEKPIIFWAATKAEADAFIAWLLDARFAMNKPVTRVENFPKWERENVR